MIEQLHFTWAEDGLQGAGRFQVTAASPGLQDLSGDLARLAMRLCRWPDRAGSDTVCFGWIDARDHRFVFHRIPTGRCPDGRPGNFAAHVLVAPAGAITAAQVLGQSCADGFWWAGQPDRTTMLPRLDPQPLRPPLPIRSAVPAAHGARDRVRGSDPAEGASAPGPDLAVVDAAEQMLGMHLSGRVAADWRPVLAAAVACAVVLPSGFDDLTSFSSFEDEETADWFRLVGMGPPVVPGSAAPALAAAAARLIASPDRADVRAARSAAQVTSDGTRIRWPEFLALAAVLHTVRGGEPVDRAALVPALGSPVTASEVLIIRRARREVAQALAEGDSRIRTPLERSAKGIGPDLLRQLGAELAEQVLLDVSGPEQPATSGHAAGIWERPVRAAAPLGAAVLDGLAEVALRQPRHDTDAWPGTLLRACLRSPALSESAVADLVRSAAGAADLPVTLADRAVPSAYRGQAAATGLKTGNLAAASFARLCQADGELLNATLAAVEDSAEVGRILDATGSEEAADVVAIAARSLPEPVRLAACEHIIRQLSPSRAVHFTAQLRGLRWPDQGANWNAVLDALLARSIHAQIAHPGLPLQPEQLTAACSPSPVGAAWQVLLRALRGAQDVPAAARLARINFLLTTPPLAHDPRSRDYAIQAVLPAARPRQVYSVLRQLTGTVHAGDLHSAIRAAVRAAGTGASLPLAADVVEIVASYQDADGALIEACGQLARRLDRADWEELDGRLRDAPATVRRRLAAIRRRSGRMPGWMAARLPR